MLSKSTRMLRCFRGVGRSHGRILWAVREVTGRTSLGGSRPSEEKPFRDKEKAEEDIYYRKKDRAILEEWVKKRHEREREKHGDTVGDKKS
jgi:hypothetical protein